MALAYLLGKLSAKPLNLKPNVPVLLVLSIIPDIDILIGEDFHRGPTHSLITAVLIFIPFFLLYRHKAIPYFLALVSHSLIGDLFIGGKIQLFWPLSNSLVFLPSPPFPVISIYSTLNVAIESSLFVAATFVLWKSKDFLLFFRNNLSNLVLAMPIFTVLLPTFAGYPLSVPVLLLPSHLFYLILFSVAVLICVFVFLNKRIKQLRRASPALQLSKKGC